MIYNVVGEAPFQVLNNSFSISPSESGYDLYLSADGFNYSYFATVASGVTRQFTDMNEGNYYKLSGNTGTVKVNWMKDCSGGGGGTAAGVSSLDGQTGALTTKTINGNAILGSGDIVISGSGSSVSYSQTLTAGTEIGQITIDGSATTIYAPAGGGSGDENYVIVDALSAITEPYEGLMAYQRSSETTSAFSFDYEWSFNFSAMTEPQETWQTEFAVVFTPEWQIAVCMWYDYYADVFYEGYAEERRKEMIADGNYHNIDWEDSYLGQVNHFVYRIDPTDKTVYLYTPADPFSPEDYSSVVDRSIGIEEWDNATAVTGTTTEIVAGASYLYKDNNWEKREISFKQTVTGGTALGTITIGDTATTIYAPQIPEIVWNQLITDGTQIATFYDGSNLHSVYVPMTSLSQADYDALVQAGTVNPNVLYIII